MNKLSVMCVQMYQQVALPHEQESFPLCLYILQQTLSLDSLEGPVQWHNLTSGSISSAYCHSCCLCVVVINTGHLLLLLLLLLLSSLLSLLVVVVVLLLYYYCVFLIIIIIIIIITIIKF